MATGKWLKLTDVSYLDPFGRTKHWEVLERTTHGEDRLVDAVEIVPILRRKGFPNELIVIAQYRAPVGKIFLELPAGLVDKGEDPVAAALRELYEETGYRGTVLRCSPVTHFGMAVSSTSSMVIHADVDGDSEQNQNPVQHLEEGEYAVVVRLSMNNLLAQLDDYAAKGFGIDGKIYSLALGAALSSPPSSL